jgi:hypothetical protein
VHMRRSDCTASLKNKASTYAPILSMLDHYLLYISFSSGASPKVDAGGRAITIICRISPPCKIYFGKVCIKHLYSAYRKIQESLCMFY